MSELKIDNPAQRLLDILEAGKKLPDAWNCRNAWIELLNVEENNEQHLLSRLAKVMELPDRILQVRRDHFSTLRGNSTHWKTCVDNAFVSQSLNSTWLSFNQHIDSRTISELSMLSDLFETRGAHAAIEADETEALLVKIIELRGDIRSSELSSAMKTMLLRQLSQLQEALESYSISGIEPVMDAVQSTLGLAVIDPEYKEEIKSGSGSQFGDRISSLLGDIANVVTVTGALPSLPAAIQTALSLLNK
ncbi:hypothetical protein FZ703_04585 [Salmonella enterica subsp. enterica serovar Bovismorbificans]|uniref:Uncharacterized protein n=1 Tax=Salmonella enterica subsp. enterica serovar Bovismorbificans TaxID=58097 RepID=A0A5X5VR33_SALET|nr:hypothetical protein [Salmonella enterica]ECR2244348.1 hypothetical protein [Salmonella enterica subsp. enterica]EEN3032227.1 hypothetical protein [Salmonella enterica subsp. enterica serovar Enteritidis]EAA5096062.1 hypothetical protein [Salmonella enterica subsp. enterica serovar Bovismorbificans]EAA7119590.1 hypothetical protein [Salmonella enterica subsp. enterica serovar Bovismorbificans]EBG5422572.1 hypothetical protein [Salmonella enterica subsp. enterica serovar Bovismorbificans]